MVGLLNFLDTNYWLAWPGSSPVSCSGPLKLGCCADVHHRGVQRSRYITLEVAMSDLSVERVSYATHRTYSATPNVLEGVRVRVVAAAR